MFKNKYIFGSIIIFFQTIIFSVFSCNKSDCFLKAGNISEETRITGFFDRIEVRGYFKIVLENDSLNKVKIRAKKNFIGNIKTQIKDSVLILEDNTKCNFTRPSEDPPELTIGTNFLREIHVYMPASFSTAGTLKLKTLLLRVYTEISDCNLTTETESLAFEIWANATGNYYLSGKTQSLNILIDGPGFLDARNLVSDFAAVRTVSMNDIYVNARYFITGNIESSGNIILYGNPSEIKEIGKGEGKFILK